MEQKTLSKEVVALVHNIELNQARWWDKTVSRLVLAAAWIEDGATHRSNIRATLSNQFKLQVTDSKLDSILSKLENAGDLFRKADGNYQIPQAKRNAFDQEILAAETNQEQAKAHICNLIEALAIDVPGAEAWLVFQNSFLNPLVNEVGANAYDLVAGNAFTTNAKLVVRYLANFDSAQHQQHRDLVTAFLDPKSDIVRQYVSRLLHARFCVDACGLPKAVLDKLSSSVGRSLKFDVYVDTNFLYSLIGIHENPSNEAALELKELIGLLKLNPKVTLLITPETIREAKHTIENTREWLNSIPTTEPYIRAALKAGVSGIEEKFMVERLRQGANLTVNGWFKPYLDDFVTMARDKGIELHNVKLDKYSMRQDVVDDITYVQEREKRRVTLLKDRKEKSYESIKHDMVLWHYMKDKRPAYVESPIDAEDWILTVDYRFIRFDEAKQKHFGQKVPICIHPSSMVQLLQFFVPRSTDFEEAMVGTIRLPFLFQEFDAEAQKTSKKILQGMGRFSLSNDATEATVTRVLMNEGLRARLTRDKTPEEEIDIIKDALVEEMQERLDAEAAKTFEVKGTLEQREAELLRIKKEGADSERKFEEDRNTAMRQLEHQHAAERDRLIKEKEEQQRTIEQLSQENTERLKVEEEAKKNLTGRDETIRYMQAQLEQIDEGKQRNAALVWYSLAMCLIVAATITAAWIGAEQFPQAVMVLNLWPCRILSGVIVFVTLHLVLELIFRKHERMHSLWPFQMVKRFRGWLWGVVFASFLVGVLGNMYSNQVQRNLDKELPAAESPVPAQPAP